MEANCLKLDLINEAKNLKKVTTLLSSVLFSFQVLHKLAAKAFINDYEDGILHENETEHEV